MGFTQTILNDLDISTSHLQRLTRELAESSTVSQHFIQTDQTTVRNAIAAFATLTTMFQSTLRVRPISQLTILFLNSLFTCVGRRGAVVQPTDAT